MLESKMARALLWSSALALSLSSMAQAQRSGYTTRQVSLPEGTVLRAELNDRLSSQDNHPGDRFRATIRSDQDESGLPSGTQVEGTVTSVRRASEKEPGTIDVDFNTLRTPDGRTYPINASLTSLDADSVRRNSSGRLEARGRSSNDKTKFIGYGAGAGALIGVLSRGNLLTSALLGAAGGYLYGQLTKDKDRNNGRYSDVNLKTGTEFGVRVDRDLVAALPYDRNSRYDTRNSRYNDQNPSYGDRGTGTYNRDRANDIRVMVNDRDVRFGADRPFMSAGRVMVPLASILDSAGYRYNYDSRDREVTVYGNRGDTRLTIGDDYATSNGRRVRLDTPAQRIDGVIYVPAQFLEDATDIRTDWDADQRILRLTVRSRAALPGNNDDRYRAP
jgi:hypothetical protein